MSRPAILLPSVHIILSKRNKLDNYQPKELGQHPIPIALISAWPVELIISWQPTNRPLRILNDWLKSSASIHIHTHTLYTFFSHLSIHTIHKKYLLIVQLISRTCNPFSSLVALVISTSSFQAYLSSLSSIWFTIDCIPLYIHHYNNAIPRHTSIEIRISIDYAFFIELEPETGTKNFHPKPQLTRTNDLRNTYLIHTQSQLSKIATTYLSQSPNFFLV